MTKEIEEPSFLVAEGDIDVSEVRDSAVCKENDGDLFRRLQSG